MSGSTPTEHVKADVTVTGTATVTDAAVEANTATTATNTSTLAGAVTAGKVQVTDSALSAAAPTPGAPTTITASVTLPASGVMETAPSGGSAGVAVPAGTVGNPTRGGTVIVLYTQGAANGEEAGLVWGWDGAEWVIIMGPGDPYVDAVYSGIPLGVGTGNYSLPFENKNGFTRIAYTGQEKGVTATPGTHVVKVVFD